MPGKKTEKRLHPRAKVSFFLDCNVRLDVPIVSEAVIEDVSWGGLRLHFRKSAQTTGLKTDDHIAGEIESENSALQMAFTGKIMWVADFHNHGETWQRVGLKFDEDVIFSEIILSLRPQPPSGEKK